MKFLYPFHRWLDQNEMVKFAFVILAGSGLFICMIPFQHHPVACLWTMVLYMAGIVILTISRVNYLNNK